MTSADIPERRRRRGRRRRGLGERWDVSITGGFLQGALEAAHQGSCYVVSTYQRVVGAAAGFAANFVSSPHHTSDRNRRERRRGVGELCGVHLPCLELEAVPRRGCRAADKRDSAPRGGCIAHHACSDTAVDTFTTTPDTTNN
jgi:hypothetical protein